MIKALMMVLVVGAFVSCKSETEQTKRNEDNTTNLEKIEEELNLFQQEMKRNNQNIGEIQLEIDSLLENLNKK